MLPPDTKLLCKKCLKPIHFIKMKSGKSMPVDPAPIRTVIEEGRVITGYYPHWATCTDPETFRKGGEFFERG